MSYVAWLVHSFYSIGPRLSELLCPRPRVVYALCAEMADLLAASLVVCWSHDAASESPTSSTGVCEQPSLQNGLICIVCCVGKRGVRAGWAGSIHDLRLRCITSTTSHNHGAGLHPVERATPRRVRGMRLKPL